MNRMKYIVRIMFCFHCKDLKKYCIVRFVHTIGSSKISWTGLMKRKKGRTDDYTWNLAWIKMDKAILLFKFVQALFDMMFKIYDVPCSCRSSNSNRSNLEFFSLNIVVLSQPWRRCVAIVFSNSTLRSESPQIIVHRNMNNRRKESSVLASSRIQDRRTC